MASKRQKKRQKKDRGGKLAQQAITASALGNPEPVTEPSGDNDSNDNKVKVNESKSKPKKANESKPKKAKPAAEPKTIIGFGSKGKSTTESRRFHSRRQ